MLVVILDVQLLHLIATPAATDAKLLRSLGEVTGLGQGEGDDVA
ncbi:MAG TPA: hypothetical protein VGD52_04105 [Pseudoduganella sp.]